MSQPTIRAERGPRARRLGLAGRIGVAALAFTLLIASGYAWALYRNFSTGVPHGDPVPTLVGTDLDDGAQDILLVGNDSRAGATSAELDALHTGHDRSTVNTDTMMVLHVPSGSGTPSVVSFPRDSWVAIPGHGKGKLNSAYSDAYNAARDRHLSETQAESDGINITIRTIEMVTGLHIDHYVQINLLGFYRISEAIGGVQVCLLHPQNKFTETDGTRHGFSGIDLPAGVSTIKGAMALAFVRQRHGLPHGDLDRIRRQQYFLDAAFRKVASAGVLLNPFKLHNLLDAVRSSLLTDPGLNLLSLARSFELLSGGTIAFQTLPNNGAQLIYPDGVETSIVAVDLRAIPSFVQQLIGHTTDLSTVTAARPGTVTIDVLNGAEIYRLATRNARQLRKLGFHIDVVDSTPVPVTATTIQYPPRRAAAAKALAAEVKGAKLIPTTAVRRVTLSLGTDGRQVNGLVTSAPTPGKVGGAARKHVAAVAVAPRPANGLGCID